MQYRIGFGYDVHRLQEGRKLILGGIEIPHHKGCLGHSDADVLIHAICDALLGAAALGDIGVHFPDTSADFKDIDSSILLEKTRILLTQNNYTIGNIDATLCLQNPKIMPYAPQMKQKLADVLQISENDVSIKATTNEKMGFVGREEGVTAYAVAIIEKNTTVN
ncbi:MAG: 2-C-methyl-D-erythritol 2,4-cyclodiphosphate synthase [Chitinophagales bacterium]|nr:2-C-methyl-D-erythritol 2,4-cyclodiphosphate synthase [Bacteroidota bacterium]